MDASDSSRVSDDRVRPALPIFAVVAANAAAGTLFAWSVLLAPLSSDLGVGTDLSTIFSGALVAFALAVSVGGRAVDESGPRRTTGLACVLSGLGSWWLAWAHTHSFCAWGSVCCSASAAG